MNNPFGSNVYKSNGRNNSIGVYNNPREEIDYGREHVKEVCSMYNRIGRNAIKARTLEIKQRQAKISFERKHANECRMMYFTEQANIKASEEKERKVQEQLLIEEQERAAYEVKMAIFDMQDEEYRLRLLEDDTKRKARSIKRQKLIEYAVKMCFEDKHVVSVREDITSSSRKLAYIPMSITYSIDNQLYTMTKNISIESLASLAGVTGNKNTRVKKQKQRKTKY